MLEICSEGNTTECLIDNSGKHTENNATKSKLLSMTSRKQSQRRYLINVAVNVHIVRLFENCKPFNITEKSQRCFRYGKMGCDKSTNPVCNILNQYYTGINNPGSVSIVGW